MIRFRTTLLAIALAIVLRPSFLQAQGHVPRGSGTPVDIGSISPSRDWMNRSHTSSRIGRGAAAKRFPSSRSFSYGYWSFYGPIYGGSFYYPYGYRNRYCGYCGNYRCNGRCYGGPYWLPPVVVDPGLLYGPRAIRNFLGVDNLRAAPVAQAAAPQPAPAVAPAVAVAPRANATARERAIKFVRYGDRHFEAGRYREALARYKKASASAGDMAEAEFRQAFAELMMGDLSDATLAIRRGLAKKPSWPQADFAIDDLFGDAAKAEAYRILQTRLQETDLDANAHFLAGVLLYFDGREEAAQPYFIRTVDLLGNAEHARVFLPVQPEAEDAAAVAP